MPRDDPYQRTNFLVDFGVSEGFGIAEVDGLGAAADVVDYRVGSETTPAVRKLPSLIRYTDVVLRRGVDGRDELWTWWHTTETGAPDRRDVTITLLDEQRQPVMRWLLRRAWPRAYDVSPLIASVSGVLVESLTLAHEGFTAKAA